jgi:hypothetical protein
VIIHKRQSLCRFTVIIEEIKEILYDVLGQIRITMITTIAGIAIAIFLATAVMMTEQQTRGAGEGTLDVTSHTQINTMLAMVVTDPSLF